MPFLLQSVLFLIIMSFFIWIGFLIFDSWPYIVYSMISNRNEKGTIRDRIDRYFEIKKIEMEFARKGDDGYFEAEWIYEKRKKEKESNG